MTPTTQLLRELAEMQEAQAEWCLGTAKVLRDLADQLEKPQQVRQVRPQ